VRQGERLARHVAVSQHPNWGRLPPVVRARPPRAAHSRVRPTLSAARQVAFAGSERAPSNCDGSRKATDPTLAKGQVRYGQRGSRAVASRLARAPLGLPLPSSGYRRTRPVRGPRATTPCAGQRGGLCEGIAAATVRSQTRRQLGVARIAARFTAARARSGRRACPTVLHILRGHRAWSRAIIEAPTPLSVRPMHHHSLYNAF